MEELKYRKLHAEVLDLEKIKDILNQNGIYTFSQISKMNEKMFDQLSLAYYKRMEWIKEARGFMKEEKGKEDE